jgi:hypothetical protein
MRRGKKERRKRAKNTGARTAARGALEMRRAAAVVAKGEGEKVNELIDIMAGIAWFSIASFCIGDRFGYCTYLHILLRAYKEMSAYFISSSLSSLIIVIVP